MTEKKQVWVSRDDTAMINGIFPGGPATGAEESLDFDHPEVIAFQAKMNAAPAPRTISDRQFFQMLAVSEAITKEEALAAVMVGTIPAALEAIVSGIADENEQFAARMLLSGATQFVRDQPLVSAVAAARGMTEQQLDEFWSAAAAL